ncbi:SNF2 family DNA or RNA helicase [Oikeobacillus pervagus]|uniref:SNF2 family DNA or RNA helicase n=1 Tax=Oikeobacillus pervagus TaxID=1325931 RepID=A0AAJ1SWW9_9BACI|nr:DEAD/DEAH box helicase [Oikeobacillus pervagus]MDQ0214109.1 SNF2 family DNA or RNA helicase [Oikeobacillus pervagus]
MSKLGNISIHMHWLEEEQRFFLFGEDRNGYIIRPEYFAKQFLLWHEESYFGTKIDISEKEEIPGITLSAWEWVTALSAEKFSHLIHWEWDDLGDLGLAIAPIIYETISSGKWLPNFNPDHQQWVIPSAVWDEFSNDFWKNSTEGLNHRELVRTVFELCAKQSIEQRMPDHVKHRLATVQSGSLSPEELTQYFDEERWREWIEIDESPLPFTIGLRLTEPEEDELPWQLETILRNKKNPEKLYSVDARLPRNWKQHLPHVEKEQNRWLRLFPWLEKDGTLMGELSEELAWQFLTNASEKLLQLGIEILLPSWWESIRQASLSLSAKVRSSQTNYRRSFVGLNAVLDFDWRLSMNGAELSEEEFQQLIEQNRRLIKVDGEWIQLDPEMIQKLQKLMNQAKKEGLTISDLLEQELTPVESSDEEEDLSIQTFAKIQIDLTRSLKKMISQLKDTTTIPLEEAPSTLQGELRPYQQLGFSWLLFLRSFGFGACLADDMGLGKTIQLISYLLKVKENEKSDTPALIICPTSVLGNWQKELEKFAPSLQVVLHYGSNRPQDEEFVKSVQQADVVLTSYGLSHLDFDSLSSIHWSTIALDEAQNIKNSQTKQSRAIRKLKGMHHIALTGTPMENRLSELWSLFDFINHGYLGGVQQFQKRYILPIEKEHSKEKIEELQSRIRPFLLRRTKKDPDVELNLPDKLEQKEYCPLTAEQAMLYESYIQETFTEIEKLSAFQRRGLILQMLNKLKQLCNHPALFLKESRSNKIIERSEKLQKLVDLTDYIMNNQEACLIFTQYIGMGEMIQQELEQRFKVKIPFLNGSMAKSQRDKLVEQFQNGEYPIFLLSLKAGGTGLNLTAANHVIHYDRWWNPAIENQATDRAYRIGQKRFVHVHKLITTGTLEEKIDEMLEKKQALNDEIIQSDQWITELSDTELHQLIKLQ